MPNLHRHFFPALGLVLLCGTVDAQDPHNGAIAPAGTWYVQGGCAARTGITATRPLLRTPERAWTYRVEGTVVGEPVVWRDVVVIEEMRDDKARYLHIVDLRDGRRLLKHPKRFNTGASLSPALWQDSIVLRNRPDKITEYRFDQRFRNPVRRREWGVKQPLSPPLVVDGEVYFATASTVYRHELGKGKATWSAPLSLHGQLAVRGTRVYGIEAKGNQRQLVALHRATGKRRGAVGIQPGNYVGAMIGSKAAVAVPTSPAAPTCRVPLPSVAGSMFSSVQLIDMLAPPLVFANRWLGFTKLDGRPTLFLSEPGGAKGMLLASPAHHAEYVRTPGPLAMAGRVVVAGARAFDVQSRSVYWTIDAKSTRRSVPARDSVLLVEDQSTVLALRDGHSKVGHGGMTAWRPSTPTRARVVTGDGEIRTGAATMRAGALTFDGADPIPLAQVRYVETTSGKPVYWPSTEDAVRSLGVLADEAMAAGLPDIAYKAYLGRDLDLLTRVIDLCDQHGVKASRMTKHRKNLEKLKTRTRPPGNAARRLAAEAKQMIDDLRRSVLDQNFARAEAAGAASPLRFAILRDILDRYPAHARTIAAVRDGVPRELLPGTAFDPGGWIDFMEASKEVTIEPVVIPQDPAKRTFNHRYLLELRQTWSKDVVAIQSRNLMVVTSSRAPGSLARCLSTGELVCEVLADLFATDDPRRSNPDRLLLLLYRDQEEYLRESEKAGTSGHLAWTAGHYSAYGKVPASRMFLPDDEDAFRAVLPVFAHELAHHWIDVRCQRIDYSAASRPKGKGHWIVEGFASLIENFVFDTVRRTYSTDNPRNDNLDLVANARPDQLLGWERMYGLAGGGFMRLGKNPLPGLQIPVGWTLGAAYGASPISMFYAQSGATCHYLFEHKRQQLLDYVIDYYNGNFAGADIEKAFGIKPHDLGQKVAEHARRISLRRQ